MNLVQQALQSLQSRYRMEKGKEEPLSPLVLFYTILANKNKKARDFAIILLARLPFLHPYTAIAGDRSL